jgi:hypothetical protein
VIIGGSLKFLRVLFDELIDKNYADGSNTYEQIVNALIYNTKGIKYGKTKKYPSKLLDRELQILSKAETINGSFDKRKESASEVRELLKKYFIAEEIEKSDSTGHQSGDDVLTDETQQSSSVIFDDDSEGIAEQEAELEEMFNSSLQNLDVSDYDKFLSKEIQNSSDAVMLPTHKWLLKNVSLHEIFDYDPYTKQNKSAYLNVVLNAKKNAYRMYSLFSAKILSKNLNNERFMQSGKIDSTRLPYYKITDEIFQSVSISENKPNHFFVFAFDWSASMRTCVNALFLKILELVEFCKLAGVNFKLILFTSELDIENLKNCRFENKLVVQMPKIINVLDSDKDSVYDIDRKMKQLFYMCNDVHINKLQDKKFELVSTPIFETLLWCNGYLLERNEQIKKIILITDGEDSNYVTFTSDHGDASQICAVPVKASFYGQQFENDVRQKAIAASNKLFEDVYGHQLYSIQLIDSKTKIVDKTLFYNIKDRSNMFVDKLSEALI